MVQSHPYNSVLAHVCSRLRWSFVAAVPYCCWRWLMQGFHYSPATKVCTCKKTHLHHSKNITISPIFDITITCVSNSLDPDETPSYSASHLDPSCLDMTLWWRLVGNARPYPRHQPVAGTMNERESITLVNVTYPSYKYRYCLYSSSIPMVKLLYRIV